MTLVPQPETEAALCALCRRAQPPFEQALAYGPYEGSLRGLIHLLKYESVRPAASVLGRMASKPLLSLAPRFRTKPLLVPVPLHRLRLRQRGFNQAAEIAREALRAAKKQGLQAELSLSALRRIRLTRSQTGLTRHQRRENLRGAFRVGRKDLIKDRDVVVVDDVFTTGTTAQECARVLLRAGAARVWVLTAARVTKLESMPAWAGEISGEDPANSLARKAGA
jgi:ComF family protein